MILISDTFIKNIILIIKINLSGRFKRVIVSLILTSMFFLLVEVRINIIRRRYPIKMKAECIQFFACRKRIQPIVAVEEIKMIPLGVVIVNN